MAIQKRTNAIVLLARVFGELGATNIHVDSNGAPFGLIESLSFRENLQPHERLFLKFDSQRPFFEGEPTSQSIWFVLREGTSESAYEFLKFNGIKGGLNERIISLNFDEVNRFFHRIFGNDNLINHDIISGNLGIQEFGEDYLINTGDISWLSKCAYYAVEDMEIKVSRNFKNLKSIKMAGHAEVFMSSEIVGYIHIDIDNKVDGMPKIEVDFRSEK